MQNDVNNVRDFYRNYYAGAGQDRNDLLRNPGVAFQSFATEHAFIRALRTAVKDAAVANILDIGCGHGKWTAELIRLGFDPARIDGVDIVPDFIAKASGLYPQIRFHCQDASSLPFADESYDVVTELTMLVSLTDESLATRIAQEICRVTKPNGHIILLDWRWMPFKPEYRAVTPRRIRSLFANKTVLIADYPAALLPPVGRWLSAHAPWLYFPTQLVCPWLASQRSYVLRRLP